MMDCEQIRMRFVLPMSAARVHARGRLKHPKPSWLSRERSEWLCTFLLRPAIPGLEIRLDDQPRSSRAVADRNRPLLTTYLIGRRR